jgi:thiosulfate/3-mercaptopyruvate sulfurtransferase
MRRALLLLLAPVVALACGGHGTPETLVVSTAWLAGHLKDPNLVILAIGDKAGYDAAHIPGAQYFEYKEIGQTSAAGLTYELPPMEKLAELFARYGVTNHSRIVVYRQTDLVTPAGRVMMTLDAMGLGANASFLDGNLATWTGERRSTTTEVPQVKPGKVEPCPQNDVIVDLAFVRGNLHTDGVRVVDARSPEIFAGTQSRPGLKAGHIEGAANLFWNSAFDASGKLKPPAELKSMFQAAGVKDKDKVVTYCFIGQQASALYLVSRYLGYDTRLYDGSWEEWVRDEVNPTVIGK